MRRSHNALLMVTYVASCFYAGVRARLENACLEGVPMPSHLLGVDNAVPVIGIALLVLMYLMLKGGEERKRARRECAEHWREIDDNA